MSFQYFLLSWGYFLNNLKSVTPINILTQPPGGSVGEVERHRCIWFGMTLNSLILSPKIGLRYLDTTL